VELLVEVFGISKRIGVKSEEIRKNAAVKTRFYTSY